MRSRSSGRFSSTRQRSEAAWEGQRLLGGQVGTSGAVGVRSQGVEVVDKGGVLRSPLLIIGFRQRDRFHLLCSPTHITLTQGRFQGNDY